MTPSIFDHTVECQVAEELELCAVCCRPAGAEVPLRLYVQKPDQPICRDCLPLFPGLDDPLILD